MVTPHYLMQFFGFAHLPQHLQDVSKPFHDLAKRVDALPDNMEKEYSLRKLLESKDCAVRAAIFDQPQGGNTNGKQ